MEDPMDLQPQLELLLETNVISRADANLRSKMDSLIRSIENLTAKKLRIEYEIKKQKRSLTRKRMELKKVSKHLTVKLESAIESGTLSLPTNESVRDGLDIDDRLFRESARLLDDD